MLDFSGAPQAVAPQLLGLALTARGDDGCVTVRITEVEAYSGQTDPASHAYRGRTSRNEVMFGIGGRLYVYRSHGLHWCCNIVCGPEGLASAVLLRAGEVSEGESLARRRRGSRPSGRRLASGPGNFAQALGLTGADNGDEIAPGGRVALDGRSVRASEVVNGPRVGVRLAADIRWRFWIADEPTVSVYRRNPRA